MKTVFIYALNDPTRQHMGKTRYIGKAEDPYARYEKHLECRHREKTHKANWINSLFEAGLAPVLEILDEVPETEWVMWEKEWIRLYRALGFSLTNGTEGGEGMVGRPVSEETREKIRSKLKGRKLSEEHSRKIRLAQTGPGHPSFGKKRSEETRRKLRQSHLGLTLSLAAREKVRAASLGRIHSVETRIKMGLAIKQAWARRKAAQCGN